MSESTKDEFTARCKLLKNIVNCWETGKSVCQTCAFIAEVSVSPVPTSILEVNQILTSVAVMDQVPTSVAEVNQVPTSVAMVSQPLLIVLDQSLYLYV